VIDGRDVFVVVDVQNDFCPGGALAVPRGDDIVPLVNELSRCFPHVVLTQDWHPPKHLSFASTHPNKRPFEMIDVVYGRQVLWPDHCVQGTQGAAFHPRLDITAAELVIRKGFRHEIDSYSAFFENDRQTPTGLGGYLRDRGFQRVYLAGLATDFCVRYSAEDAHRLGFTPVIVEDACRGIDTGGSMKEAQDSFRRFGIELTDATEFLS
jgi:nicotinamidase/pyrazinamidase